MTYYFSSYNILQFLKILQMLNEEKYFFQFLFLFYFLTCAMS